MIVTLGVLLVVPTGQGGDSVPGDVPGCVDRDL